MIVGKRDCWFCGKTFYESGYNNFCGPSCYHKNHYRLNREKRLEYFRKRHKETYVLKEKPPKMSPEEKRAKCLEYYYAHKEYYKKKNHEYYLRHKNDPEFRKKKNEATKQYLKRRRMKEWGKTKK